MPYAPKSYRPAHQADKRKVEQSWQSRRNGNHAMYNLWAWRKPNTGIRALVLKRDPLCVDCLKRGELTPSTDADHEIPHKGDMALFLDMDNIRGRCKSCHSAKTMKENRS